MLRLQVTVILLETHTPVLMTTQAFRVSDAFVISAAIVRDGEIEGSTHDIPYLVESLRSSSAVLKFTGTLGASTKTDKKTMTVAAFSHFIMSQTACALSFSDLQGMLPYDLWITYSLCVEYRVSEP
jgi:hypothetical protein